MKKNLLFAELSSDLLILLFGYTAVSKVLQFGLFRHALAESPVAHKGAAVAVWLIISAEAVTVLLLFVNRETEAMGKWQMVSGKWGEGDNMQWAIGNVQAVSGEEEE